MPSEIRKSIIRENLASFPVAGIPAKQNVMEALLLLRNYEEGHRQAVEGEWDLPKVGARNFNQLHE